MKLFYYILIFLFPVITVPSIYAAEDSGEASQYRCPSILSSARVQMLQQLDAILGSAHTSRATLNPGFVSPPDQPTMHKDRKKAFFRSLIMPGAGEHYLGKRTLAKAFFATEVTLWLSYFAFRQYGKWLRNDALAFAATHSGANIEGKPSQFFVDIGNYIDIYEYNDFKLRFGEVEKIYDEADYFWSWDQDNNRSRFENMRIASDRALNRSTFVLGAVFANHLISAIHASWQTHRYNKKLDQVSNSGIHVHISSNCFSGELLLNIQKEF